LYINIVFIYSINFINFQIDKIKNKIKINFNHENKLKIIYQFKFKLFNLFIYFYYIEIYLTCQLVCYIDVIKLILLIYHNINI